MDPAISIKALYDKINKEKSKEITNYNLKWKGVKIDEEMLSMFKYTKDYVTINLDFGETGSGDGLLETLKNLKDDAKENKTAFVIKCRKRNCDVIIGRRNNFERISMKKNETCKLKLEKVSKQ